MKDLIKKIGDIVYKTVNEDFDFNTAVKNTKRKSTAREIGIANILESKLMNDKNAISKYIQKTFNWELPGRHYTIKKVNGMYIYVLKKNIIWGQDTPSMFLDRFLDTWYPDIRVSEGDAASYERSKCPDELKSIPPVMEEIAKKQFSKYINANSPDYKLSANVSPDGGMYGLVYMATSYTKKRDDGGLNFKHTNGILFFNPDKIQDIAKMLYGHEILTEGFDFNKAIENIDKNKILPTARDIKRMSELLNNEESLDDYIEFKYNTKLIKTYPRLIIHEVGPIIVMPGETWSGDLLGKSLNYELFDNINNNLPYLIKFKNGEIIKRESSCNG